MAARRKAMTGYAMAGAALRVVDSDGADVAANGEEIGEIVVRSNVVMEGYYRDPEGTAEKIRDGWFHTGDMAVIDEVGYITIMDTEPGTLKKVVFCCFDERALALHRAAIGQLSRTGV